MSRRAGLWVWIGVFLVSGLYLATLWNVGGGRPIAPLDDAYIHFQYARQFSRGHPWQYNDGDPYSTGDTSFLYPILLAGGYRLGFHGEHLIWFALGLGVLSLGLSAGLVYRLTSHLAASFRPRDPTVGRYLPVVAVAFFLLTGAVQWAYLSGMEGGLFTVFILAALDALVRGRCPALWIGLAALTRPEGLILAAVLWLVVLLRHRRLAPPVLRLTLSILLGLLPLAVNLALTGSPVATGAQAKSWLGNVPFRPGDILHSVLLNAGRILGRFTLGYQAPHPWPLAPGLLPLAAVGWLGLLRRRRWEGVILTLGWFAAGTLTTAALITATWQVGRYQTPFLALLIPFAAVGLALLAGWRRWPGVVLALVVLAASLASTLQGRSLYARALHTVAGQHLRLADWIRRELPADARLGVHDTGAIRYVGERPVYDLIGLTTQGAATAWRHGAGAVFERMEHSPQRPDYFATYPDVFSLPYLAATDLFAVRLFRAEVPDFAIASAGPVQAVYRADWRLADSGNQVYQEDIRQQVAGLPLLDRLDVADLDDEAAHDLRFWEGTVRPGFPTEVQQYHYRTDPAIEVLDGGRLFTGGTTFHLAARPGEPLLLVARLHAAQAGAVRVAVDGHDVGLWRYPPVPGEWLESRFLVPATAISRERVTLRLQVAATNPDFRHYALYHLWAYAGAPTFHPVTPSRPLDARLGDAVRLIGYDLAPEALLPGASLRLTLYWRAASTSTADAKVFVHLYNAQDEIVAQQDRRPYYGTRPPYTWSPGETLTDPYALLLPPDLAPGRYTLAVGMYDPLSLTRWPVTTDAAHRLPDDRVLLTTVEIGEHGDE